MQQHALGINDQIARYVPPEGAMSYRPVAGWPLMPHGTSFAGDATSVAVNSKDEIHVFSRGPEPMLVFDRDGTLLRSWGAGEFDNPHGISFDADDNVFLVDAGGHFVEKRSPAGETLLTLGIRGAPADVQSGTPFNRPTDAATHPRTGELFVSDGYGNSSIHRFSPEGAHLQSWGESGADPGQFHIPHGICVTEGDRVFVCDRENWRIQVFTTSGEFVDLWWVHHPMAIRHHDGLLYVAESGPAPSGRTLSNLGHRVSVFDLEGNVVARFGAPLSGTALGEFYAPHGIAVDSFGDVYVAEVTRSFMVAYYRQDPPTGEPRSLSRWQREE